MEVDTKSSLHCKINNVYLLKHYASLSMILTTIKRRVNVNDFQKFHKNRQRKKKERKKDPLKEHMVLYSFLPKHKHWPIRLSW